MHVGIGVGVSCVIIVLLLVALVWIDITKLHYCLPWKISKCKEMLDRSGNRNGRMQFFFMLMLENFKISTKFICTIDELNLICIFRG